MGFVVGIILIIVGAGLTAAEARACAYERHNLGPGMVLLGIAAVMAAIAKAIL